MISPTKIRRPDRVHLEADDDLPMIGRRGNSQPVQSGENSPLIDTVVWISKRKSIEETHDSKQSSTSSGSFDNQVTVSSLGSHSESANSDSLERMYSLCRTKRGMGDSRPESFHKAELPNRSSASDTNTALKSSARVAEIPRNAPKHETTVVELESLIKELRAAAKPDFTSDVIVNAMKENPMATQVQLFCLSTIWDLSKYDDAYNACLISTSAPDDILLAMMNHMSSAAIQERGCGALGSLSVNEQSRSIVARAGAPARIIRAIIDHRSDESVVFTGIGALRNLSSESDIKETLVKLQAPLRVAEAMAVHRISASVQREGCAFLSNTAIDLDRYHVSIVTDKEIGAVIEAIRAHPKEPSVVTGACFALKNYSIEESNLNIMAKFPDAVELLEHVANHSKEMRNRRSANIVLDRLRSTGRDNDLLEEQACTSVMNLVHQESVPSDAVSTVLEVMKEHEFSVKLMSNGLRSLLTLANHSDLHRDRINDSALKQVIATMRRYEGDSAIQINACGLLGAMAGYGPKCRKSIFEGQGCIAIVNAIRQHTSDISVQVAACGALRALSIDFDCWFELEQSGNTAIVQEVMSGHPDSSMLQQLVTDILTNFSAHCEILGPTTQ
jgi:hypothetical protein